MKCYFKLSIFFLLLYTSFVENMDDNSANDNNFINRLRFHSLEDIKKGLANGTLSNTPCTLYKILIRSCIYGYLDIITFLFEHGCTNLNIENSDGTPLHIACNYRHNKIIKFLLEHGANPDRMLPTFQRPPLIDAISSNDEIVDCFHIHGGNLNIQDIEGNTALHHATLYPYEDGKTTVNKLLLFGADPTIKNKKGETASDSSKANFKKDPKERTIIGSSTFGKLVDDPEYYSKILLDYQNNQSNTSIPDNNNRQSLSPTSDIPATNPFIVKTQHRSTQAKAQKLTEINKISQKIKNIKSYQSFLTFGYYKKQNQELDTNFEKLKTSLKNVNTSQFDEQIKQYTNEINEQEKKTLNHAVLRTACLGTLTIATGLFLYSQYNKKM